MFAKEDHLSCIVSVSTASVKTSYHSITATTACLSLSWPPALVCYTEDWRLSGTNVHLHSICNPGRNMPWKERWRENLTSARVNLFSIFLEWARYDKEKVEVRGVTCDMAPPFSLLCPSSVLACWPAAIIRLLYELGLICSSQFDLVVLLTILSRSWWARDWTASLGMRTESRYQMQFCYANPQWFEAARVLLVILCVR